MLAKSVTKTFRIHDLVVVRAQSSSEAKMAQIMHQLAEFEAEETSPQPDIQINDYGDRPHLVGGVVVGDYCVYSEGFLDIPAQRLCFNLIEPGLKVYGDWFGLPLNMLVQIVLLKKGFSLVHSAAVEFEGKNHLFAAFGGAGKTILTAALMFGGGKLYGDDMNIVGGNEVVSYPQDLAVYPYHLPLLNLKDRRVDSVFRRNARFDRIIAVLKNLDVSPARVVRRALESRKSEYVSVSPRRVFGDGCFADRGAIHNVYYIVRTSSKSHGLERKAIDPKALAGICTDVLFHELSESLRPLCAYSALSSFSLEGLIGSTRFVLERVFGSLPCSEVVVPGDMESADFQREMTRLIREK